jgi:GH43 family beta-xylosidase
MVACLTPSASVENPLIRIRKTEVVPLTCTISLDQLIIVLGKWMIAFSALSTDALAQTLSQHAEHGVGKIESVAAHV